MGDFCDEIVGWVCRGIVCILLANVVGEGDKEDCLEVGNDGVQEVDPRWDG